KLSTTEPTNFPLLKAKQPSPKVPPSNMPGCAVVMTPLLTYDAGSETEAVLTEKNSPYSQLISSVYWTPIKWYLEPSNTTSLKYTTGNEREGVISVQVTPSGEYRIAPT